MSFGRTVAVVARVALVRARRRSSTGALCALALLPAAAAALAGSFGHDALGLGGPLAVRLVAPLLAVALVAGPVGELHESRTVVYYFTRPVPRAAVVLGEWLGYAALVGAALLVCGALLAVACGGDVAAALGRVPPVLFGEGVALAGFSVGVATAAPKRPLVAALGILALTDGVLASLPGVFRYGALSFHVQNLAGIAAPAAESGGDLAAGPFGPAATAVEVSTAASVAVLLAYGVLPVVLGTLVAKDRDLK